MAAANSAVLNAPSNVITPATTQIPSNAVGEPNCAAITPGLRKIPDPITPPATNIVVLKNPSAGSSPDNRGWADNEEGMVRRPGTLTARCSPTQDRKGGKRKAKSGKRKRGTGRKMGRRKMGGRKMALAPDPTKSALANASVLARGHFSASYF